MAIDDGGPAFPHHTAIPDGEGGWKRLHEWGFCEPGMSLLDWYAGEALKGWNHRSGQGGQNVVARECFIMAEAMIAEKRRREAEWP